MTHVVVVGGGIAGLACAHELATAAPRPTAITVLEPGRIGGKLQTSLLGDQVVDVGPDGFLARRPEATALVHELHRESQLEPVGASGAWIYARRRLRKLPEGLALGVPTRLRDLRTTTAIGMLGPLGALRAGLDLVAPRRARRPDLQDRAIGPLVADKLGHRVVDVLVDPLVGGIHAGRVKDLSSAAVFPPLLEAARRRGSLMRALRELGGGGAGREGPAFFTLLDGLGALPEMLSASLLARGVELHRAPATGLSRRGAGWSVATDAGELDADAVVLATPAPVTRALLSEHDPSAAALLGTIDAAGVATIALRYDATDLDLPDTGTGVLVPSSTRRGDGTFLVSAVTFLDRKWPHLHRDGATLLRVSVGRIDDRRFEELDDDMLLERVNDELDELIGLRGAPTATLVTRWSDALPQYRVNHLARVDAIEAALGSLGAIAACGAAYRGVGVPACIASGRAAARTVRSALVTQSS